MKIFNLILRQFIPTICPACNDVADSNFDFCKSCMGKLDFIGDIRCKHCGGDVDTILDSCTKCLKESTFPWGNAISVLRMKGLTSELLQKFKYSGSIELARQFGKLASDALKNADKKYDAIVPVPIHWLKYLYRGYNQTTLVADYVSRLSGVQVCKCLKKTKFTMSQTKLSGKKRRENLTGVFSVAKAAYISGLNLILIDDVFTTGSTLRSAAVKLLEAGAKSVDILVLARK